MLYRDAELQQALCKVQLPVAALPPAQARMVLQYNHEAQVTSPGLVRQHLRSRFPQLQRSVGNDAGVYASLLAYCTSGTAVVQGSDNIIVSACCCRKELQAAEPSSSISCMAIGAGYGHGCAYYSITAVAQ